MNCPDCGAHDYGLHGPPCRHCLVRQRDEARDALRRLVDALPRCEKCRTQPATLRDRVWGENLCEACMPDGYLAMGSEVEWLERDEYALRHALHVLGNES